MIAVIGVYLLFDSLSGGGGTESETVPTAIAKITTLTDKVVEQGELESQSTINGNCEIDDHENKIIFLAPEGSLVKKGEVVVKFDPSDITKEITERETRVNEATTEVESARQELRVQEDENASSIRKAKQEFELAKLDLRKYLEGDYLVKKSEIEGTISEARTEVDKSRRDVESMETLVKRGFRNYEQLREAQQKVTSAELRLQNALQKLDSLEKFEFVKSKAECEGKLKEAEHQFEIAKTTAAAKLAKAKDRLKNEERGLKIQKDRLEELKKNLDRHVMKAPQDGTIAYARDNWRGQGEKIHEGSLVYQNQPVFVLPDMTRMQVKVGIHETLVSKVKVGQRAVIRVDAFSATPLAGTVKSVSPLSASTRWEKSNNYHVIVTIDGFGEEMKLKPGMTAVVEIRVGEYKDVLAVPIQAVTSFGRKKFVFVHRDGDEFEAREITTGDSNISFVSITSGLEANETVALDAYQRGIIEFGSEEPEEETMDLPDVVDESNTVGETTGEAADPFESSESAKKSASEDSADDQTPDQNETATEKKPGDLTATPGADAPVKLESDKDAVDVDTEPKSEETDKPTSELPASKSQSSPSSS